MAGHDTHSTENSGGPWQAGWLVALIVGIVAAILAKWLGGTSAVTAVLIGIFVFLIFGVLLGQYWDKPSPNALGDIPEGPHAHDDHGHEGHGHEEAGHGHAEPVPEPETVAAPEPEPEPEPVAQAVAPEPAAEPEPEPVAPAAAAEAAEPGKPVGLSGPRGGRADDLKEIEGIGPALEKVCNEMGVYHYDQIASWGEAEVAWMDGNLKGFRGRVTRDKWVAQAKLIVAEGLEAFRIRAKTNDY